MSNAVYHVRRATVDDLPELVALWNSWRLPADELERRLTEFQLVVSDDGALLGALGLETHDRQARLHSEAFNDFALADILRAQLWERMRSVATNLGLARLWTIEAAPFWKQSGFHPPDADALARLPSVWTSPNCDWLTLRLRDEDALRASLEMNFERLKIEERQQTDRIRSTARLLKFAAVFGGILVAAAAIYFCIHLLRHLPQLLHRG